MQETPHARGTLRIVPLGHALSLFFVVSFVLCVLWGLATPPRLHMHPAWEAFLPGFEWLTWRGFLFGLIDTYLYGWYVAVVFVPLYRIFARSSPRSGSPDVEREEEP